MELSVLLAFFNYVLLGGVSVGNADVKTIKSPLWVMNGFLSIEILQEQRTQQLRLNSLKKSLLEYIQDVVKFRDFQEFIHPCKCNETQPYWCKYAD